MCMKVPYYVYYNTESDNTIILKIDHYYVLIAIIDMHVNRAAQLDYTKLFNVIM